MVYQVTLDQYTKLTEARDNWPGKLSFNWESFSGSKRCVVGYLTSLTSLDDGEVDSGFSGLFSLNSFKPGGLEKLSQIYGLPTEELEKLYYVNCDKIFGSKERSRRSLNEFQRILGETEILSEPIEADILESHEREEKLYKREKELVPL